MAEAFIGEIRMFPYTFAPRFWVDCDGQLLQIAQNEALFSIIGATYGGDWRTTMGVPNLKGRAPMHWGTAPGLSTHNYGSFSGSPKITLSEVYLPVHQHNLYGTEDLGDSASPNSQSFLGKDKAKNKSIRYTVSDEQTADQVLNNLAMSNAGSSQAHENRQPSLGVRFCMCIDGEYPARN